MTAPPPQALQDAAATRSNASCIARNIAPGLADQVRRLAEDAGHRTGLPSPFYTDDAMLAVERATVLATDDQVTTGALLGQAATQGKGRWASEPAPADFVVRRGE